MSKEKNYIQSKLTFPKSTDSKKRKLSVAIVDVEKDDMADESWELVGGSKKFKTERNDTTLRNSTEDSDHDEANLSAAGPSGHDDPNDDTDDPDAIHDDGVRADMKGNSDTVKKGISVAKLRKAPNCYNPSDEIKIKFDDCNQFLFRIPIDINCDLQLNPPHMEYSDGRFSKDNHVYMPCSPESQLPMKEPERSSDIKIVNRWKVIKRSLGRHIPGTFELQEAILKYNAHYRKRWDFDNLREFSDKYPEQSSYFFERTLPKMKELALNLDKIITRPLRFLKKDKDCKHQRLMMSQEQAACLLANAFLCTFPGRNLKFNPKSSLLPNINFSSLFNGPYCPRKIQKLRCITHYFQRVTEKMPTGVISFTRQRIRDSSWLDTGMSFTDVHVTSGGTIEDDGEGMLQADFANKFLGGGVLGRGCVQEEIRFMICPEMILSRLFTEVLSDQEVLIMKGCERFSNYSGYGDTFKWDGDYKDKAKRDTWNRLSTEVVAMDAIHFRKNVDNQFSYGMVKRELMKAYCAFLDPEHTDNLPAVCTGSWGCVAFGGNTQLKALIQIIAASHANRQVCYFTFGDEKLCREINEIIEILKTHDLETDSVLTHIKDYKPSLWGDRSLFNHIKDALGV